MAPEPVATAAKRSGAIFLSIIWTDRVVAQGMLVQPIDKSSELPAAIGSAALRPSGFQVPGGLCAVIVDGAGSIAVQSGGKPLPPPVIKVALPLSDGGNRQLIIFHPSAGARIDLSSRETGVIAPVVPGDFAPLERGALLLGLDSVGRLRLMRQMLDVCRDLFDLRHDVGYGRLCRALTSDLVGTPASLQPQAVVSDRFALASGTLPAGFGAIKDLFVVGERGIGAVQHQPQPFGRNGTLFLLERAMLRAGSLLVALGEHEVAAWKVGELPDLPFLSWLRANRKQARPVRGFVVRALADAAALDASAEILLRELELLQPAAKRDIYDKATPIGAGIDLLVSDGAGGIFLRGWLRDPHQLVVRAELSCPGMAPQRLDETWLRFPRPDIDKHYDGRPLTNGFAAFLPAAGRLHGQAKIELHLASGATLDVLARPAIGNAAQLRDAILGAVPPECLTTQAIAEVIAPPAARLHADYLGMRKTPDIVELGTKVANPTYSIIVPLYRNLDYLRFQIGAFAVDPTLRGAEIIYVLDSPEQRADLVHFLSGLHQLYDLPLTILIMSGNFGYAAANNAAAAVARGKFLLLLNSDVVPEESGWLERLAAPLLGQPKAVASGARLLFDDQSLQHAGMRFARDAGGHWLNLHYFKGAPRDFAPALSTRPVPAVTGAALLVRADSFRSVGGFTEDYIIGDYEDSDLCLKLRAAGGEIYFCPDATLFHFERKSINRHAGYQRSVAGLYNRWLAGRRWDQSMSELMGRFEAAEAGAVS